jgi:protein-tyrosine phosphatase
MFSLFKKKHPAQHIDFSGLHTDIHSHLLPGIDDGSPDITTSLELKKGLEDLGYSRFVTTPHIMSDMYRNTPATIGAALELLKQQPAGAPINAAAEYFMDDYFDRLLENKEPLLTVWENKVLVEFSFVSPPINFKEKLFNLQINGYQPILAHPERYTFFASSKKIFDELKSIGCLFQVNILSFAGYYGKVQQELAHYLVSKKYIDFLGTDLHHQRHLDGLRHGGVIMPVLQQLLDGGTLGNAKVEGGR